MKKLFFGLLCLVSFISNAQVDTTTLVQKVDFHVNSVAGKTLSQFPPLGLTRSLQSLRNIAVASYGWGNHSLAGYVTTTQLSNYATLEALSSYATISSLSNYATNSALTSGLAGKENNISPGTVLQYYRGDKSWQTLDAATVGLGNVNNTSDANKPVSSATQTALNAKEPTIAPGLTSQYYRGDKSWQPLDATAVGLSNVNNTSDAAKPISTATQTALDLKANDNTVLHLAGTETITGAKTVNGQITMGSSIIPDGDATRNLGNTTRRFQAFISTILKGSDAAGLNISSVGSNDAFARFHPTTHNLTLQAPGTGAADAGQRLQVQGTTLLNGTTTLGGDMVADGDNTRSLGSTTLRYGSVYTINVSKGNAGNSFNITTTGGTGVVLRVQPTTQNVYIQQAGAAPAESNYRLTVDGTGASGALLVANGISVFGNTVQPSANGTLDLGTTSFKWNNLYANAVRGNGTLRLTAGTANSIIFSQTSDANTIAQFFGTTGNMALQAPGALPTDDGTNRLQVAGTVKANTLLLTSVPVYADNAAATAGGLAVGSIYRTSTGVLMIRF